MEIVTLRERKAAAVAAKAAAIEAVCTELAVTASELGGRYLVFGSAARGELRHDSDLDLLLDFPSGEVLARAWDAAEEACGRRGLPCDIVALQDCDRAFLDHVFSETRVVR